MMTMVMMVVWYDNNDYTGCAKSAGNRIRPPFSPLPLSREMISSHTGEKKAVVRDLGARSRANYGQ